ncbi:MAG: hypothetical protein AB3N17_16620 [Tateyamaria sp.]
MSKELQKFEKEFAPLEKLAKAIRLEFDKHSTNREHHKQMLVQSAEQIGRDVQKAKDAGAQGTELKHFMKDANVLSTMKTVMNALGQLGKEEQRLSKVEKDAVATKKKLDALQTTIEKEVATREKKKDRKVLAKDSKSLPDMVKLGKKVKSTGIDLDSDVTQIIKMEKWSAAKERKNFDGWAATEIGRTKSDRNTRDTDQTDEQAFNVRNVQKHVGQMKKLVEAAKASCTQAANHYKNKEAAPGGQAIEAAHKALGGLKKLHEPYKRRMDKMNKYDKMGMQQSKDGKFILGAIDAMEKSIDGVTQLLKKTSRLSM